MSKVNINLDKKQTTIMKGVAIMMIALHNLLHATNCFIKENESSFDKTSPTTVFSHLFSLSDTWIGDILSFFGWYGVPVFIFLTGYGLVQKYEKGSGINFTARHFLWYNYTKLLLLVIPATVFLILYLHNTRGLLLMLFQLTFLNDIIYNICIPFPGVYWYFGLTMQLYIIYCLLLRKNKKAQVFTAIFLSIFSIIIQSVIAENVFDIDNYFWLKYIRHNFIGWFVIFYLGIYISRLKSNICFNKFLYVLLVVAAFGIFCVSIFEPTLWQLSPLCAVFLIHFMSRLISKTKYVSLTFLYLGKISSCIFVIHPLVRIFILPRIMDDNQPYVYILIYLMLIIIFSIAYKALISNIRDTRYYTSIQNFI